MVTSLLRELNDEVKGVGLDEDPVELIEKSPDFFAKFSCVVATDLPEQVYILKSTLPYIVNALGHCLLRIFLFSLFLPRRSSS